MFFVVITEKGGTQQKLEFDEERISIGRVQGNDVILPRGNVSKRHAMVEYKNQQFVVTDLGSTNGTYINGRRVQEPTPIISGDKIYVGDYIVSLDGHPALGKRDTHEPQAAAEPLTQEDFEAVESVPAPPRPARKKVPVPAPRSRTVSQPPEMRTSAPPSAPASLKEEAVSAPSGAAMDTIPPGAEEMAGDSAGLTKYAEALLDQVLRQVKRIDRSNIPARVDSGVSANLRSIMDDLVVEAKMRGKLPAHVDTGMLKGKVFRSAVHIGPLAAWLDDPDVEMVRITGANSAFLLKGGNWQKASESFQSEQDLAEVQNCLGAGLDLRDDEGNGVSWYRLEDGFLVFSSRISDSVSGPALVVDKTASRISYEALNPKARAIVAELLGAKARIAVVGATESVRLTVMGELVDLLRKEEFVVSVEQLPLVARARDNWIRLCVRSRSGDKSNRRDLGSLLPHAVGLEPAWLVISGADCGDLPRVLSASAGRPGVLAELPLGAHGRLERELSLALTAAGSPVSTIQAALLLEEAFDTIVVAGRHPGGAVLVKQVLKCELSDAGQWNPKVLFERRSR